MREALAGSLPLREVLKTNNPVLLNFAQVLLADAGIDAQVFDSHTSVIEGSLGILPRRVMVPDAQHARAETVLRDGLAATEPRGEDRFLGGRVSMQQPEAGFRSGLDAVMLAAAVAAHTGDTVLELGSGAGVASLCLAARVEDCDIVGVEIDAALTDMANANAHMNGATARFVCADVFALPQELKRDFSHVFCNPPFHGDGESSPDASRALALQDGGRLGDWLALGLKRTISNGTFTTIIRADRLGEALTALPAAGLTIFPLWPKADAEAKRLILSVAKDSRAPLRILPGLVLHESNGGWTPGADEVLSDGKGIDLR
jgi:tRNA1(Val) A37 N6-methylase TrmN6